MLRRIRTFAQDRRGWSAVETTIMFAVIVGVVGAMATFVKDDFFGTKTKDGSVIKGLADKQSTIVTKIGSAIDGALPQ